MTLKTKAAVLRALGEPLPYAQSRPIKIEELTLIPPGPMDILVKVVGAGLCHSDLSVINGSLGRGLPVVLGHEGAGEVLEVGSAVTDVKKGDHIAFQFAGNCGRCKKCQAGKPQLCEAFMAARAHGGLMSGGIHFRDANDEPVKHMVGVACFSEYVVVHRGSVVVITDELPLTEAALFGCAVMTGVGAVVNTSQVKPGESVAIFGLGGVGLCGLMGAKVSGAETIIAVDLEDAKLKKAMELGATHTFNARDPDLVEKIKDLTDGGVDHAIELAGAIPAMEAAYAVATRGGKVVTAGLSGTGKSFSINHGDLVLGEKHVCGSYMGSCVPMRDIPRFIKLYQSGALPVDALIDGLVTFDELNEGFDRLHNGTALRQVLVPHGPASVGGSAKVQEGVPAARSADV